VYSTIPSRFSGRGRARASAARNSRATPRLSRSNSRPSPVRSRRRSVSPVLTHSTDNASPATGVIYPRVVPSAAERTQLAQSARLTRDFGYLSDLPAVAATDSDNEETKTHCGYGHNKFPEALAESFIKLPSHHTNRQPNSQVYKKLKARVSQLVIGLDTLVNFQVPNKLEELVREYYQREYTDAQATLKKITLELARVRRYFRLGLRTARAGGWIKFVRDLLSLQPLYRILHNSAYAYSKLLKVRLLPVAFQLYVLGNLTAVESQRIGEPEEWDRRTPVTRENTLHTSDTLFIDSEGIPRVIPSSPVEPLSPIDERDLELTE
jgi:hypothetical protein